MQASKCRYDYECKFKNKNQIILILISWWSINNNTNNNKTSGTKILYYKNKNKIYFSKTTYNIHKVLYDT